MDGEGISRVRYSLNRIVALNIDDLLIPHDRAALVSCLPNPNRAAFPYNRLVLC